MGIVALGTALDPVLAAELATRYGLPREAPGSRWSARIIAAADGALVLAPAREAQPLRVDFASDAPRRRLLERAVGVGRGVRRVVDATTGLGRDAWALMRAGCEVTLCERTPWLAALLDSALERAGRAERVVVGPAQAVLASLDPRPDAVYLDPMFAPRNKSALPKREIALLRALCGESADDAELLALARRVALRRVVVKRHRGAPVLAGGRIAVVEGHLIRYDVYAPR